MPYTIVPFDGDGDDALGDDWAIPVATAIGELQTHLGLVAPPGLLAADSTNYGTVGSDVTNLTVTWTAFTGVRYRTVANIPWLQKDGAGAAQVELRILDGSGAVLLRRPFEVAANEDFGMRLEYVEPTLLLNGSRTRKAFIITSSGDVDIFGLTSVASLTVEAIGIV